MSALIDHQLEHRARNILEQHPHLARRRVRLEATQGRLTLRGHVKSYFQKQLAQEALRNLEGVSQLENLLEVQW
jgi:osmotically-inducible protein OsmY